MILADAKCVQNANDGTWWDGDYCLCLKHLPRLGYRAQPETFTFKLLYANIISASRTQSRPAHKHDTPPIITDNAKQYVPHFKYVSW